MEAIEASATLKFFRISPQKTRLVADLIRGRKADEAVRILSFTGRKAAGALLKLLQSAIANAEVKNVEDTELLEVSQVWVNQGPALRRYRPRARGKADVWRRPTSHVTIVVRENLEAKREAEERRRAHEARRARKKAGKKEDAVKGKEPATAGKAAAKKSAAKKPAAKKPTAKKPAATKEALARDDTKTGKKTGGKAAAKSKSAGATAATSKAAKGKKSGKDKG